MLGDRQTGVLAAVRPEFGVEFPEMLRAKFGQLVPLEEYVKIWLRDVAPDKLAKATLARDRQDIGRFMPDLGRYKPQCGDDLLYRLLVSNQFIFFLTGVFVGAPSGVV